MLRNRRGILVLSQDMYNKELELLSTIFTQMSFIPTNVFWDYLTNNVEISGFSKLFNELEEHTVVPKYVINDVTHDIEGKLTFKVELYDDKNY